MGRRRKALALQMSPRRMRRCDRKLHNLMDIVEGGVRHLGPNHLPSSDDRPTGREHSAAEHGRMAAAGLFKLSSDILAVISHTISARLVGDGRDASTVKDGDYDYENNMADDIGGPSRCKNMIVNTPIRYLGDSEESGLMCVGQGSDQKVDSQQVVRITGTAFTEISAAAAQGSVRVLEAAVKGDADSSLDATTRDNIFRIFKEAAMNIVHTARTFGEALGGTTNDERPKTCRRRNTQDEDYDSLSLHVGSEFSAMFSDQRLDAEDFLHCLLQEVRDFVQRTSNSI